MAGPGPPARKAEHDGTDNRHRGPGRDGGPAAGGERRKSYYPYWFLVPGGLIFAVFFLLPSVIAFYFSLTRWTLFDQEFIGLDNFRQFFAEPALISGLTHTLFYAVVTSGLKVVLGMALALLLTGPIVGRPSSARWRSSRCW